MSLGFLLTFSSSLTAYNCACARDVESAWACTLFCPHAQWCLRDCACDCMLMSFPPRLCFWFFFFWRLCMAVGTCYSFPLRVLGFSCLCMLLHVYAVVLSLWLCLFSRLCLFLFFVCVFAHLWWFLRACSLCLWACLCAFVSLRLWLRAFARLGAADCAAMCNFHLCADGHPCSFWFVPFRRRS